MQRTTRLWHLFDRWVLIILRAILAFGIVAAIAIVIWLLKRHFQRATVQRDNIAELQ